MKIISLHNGHDASITAIEDGEILGHWELERVLNIKHFCGVDHSNEIGHTLYDHVLPRLNWAISDIDAVVFAGKTEWKKTEFAGMVPQYDEFDRQKPYAVGSVELRDSITRPAYSVVHHVNHMAYAYYTSPFIEATLFSYDGIGDGTSTMGGYGDGNELYVTDIASAKDSLIANNGIGLTYSYLGRMFPFLGNDLLATAGKAMGLSSYGTPYEQGQTVYQLCNKMIREWMPDPSRYKNDIQREIGMSLDFGNPMNKECQNVMATIQQCMEDYVRWTVSMLCTSNNCYNVAMAGGCALNVQVNSALIETGVVNSLYVPPATSDCGVSIGAALYVYYNIADNEFGGIDWHNPYLGDEVYSPVDLEGNPTDVADWMDKHYPELAYCWNMSEEEQVRDAAAYLADRKIIAWAQGRAEIGPRALGNRSILCHPGPLQDEPGDMKWLEEWKMGGGSMKLTINEAVKHREFWRPFAPIALWPDCREYFDIDHEQPYMLEAPMVKDWNGGKRALEDGTPLLWHEIPAVVHVDGTARVQTVTDVTNPTMHKLLSKFNDITGLPVLLNTSLNDAGIPINNRIEDILDLVKNTDVDVAFVGNWFFYKKKITRDD